MKHALDSTPIGTLALPRPPTWRRRGRCPLLLLLLVIAGVGGEAVAQPLPNPLYLARIEALDLPNGPGHGIEHDGTSLLVDSGGMIRFLDPDSGAEIRSIPSTTDLRGLALHAGEIVTVSRAGFVRFLDPLTGAVSASFDLSADLPFVEVHGAAVIGNELFVGHTKRIGDPTVDVISVFDVASGAFLRTFFDPGGSAHLTSSGGLMLLRGELWTAYESFVNVSRFSPVDGTGTEVGVTPLVVTKDPGSPLHPLPRGLASDGVSKVFLIDGHAASVEVFLFTCGNGAIDPGEECDDGDIVDGDGCSANCRIVGTPAPTRTATQTATPTTTSTPSITGCPASPQAGCDVPVRSILAIRDREANGAGPRDRLLWKYVKGPQTTRSAFGDPLSTASYHLCVYQGATLLLTATVPPAGICSDKPCWKAIGTTGYSFKDAAAAEDGAFSLSLEARPTATGTRLAFRGKNGALGLTSTTLPLSISTIAVRMLNSDNANCWGVDFPSASVIRNEETYLKAKLP